MDEYKYIRICKIGSESSTARGEGAQSLGAAAARADGHLADTPGTDSAPHRGLKSMACHWSRISHWRRPQNWTVWWSDSHQMKMVRLWLTGSWGTVAKGQDWKKGAKVMISILNMNS